MSRIEFDKRLVRSLWFRERGYTPKRAAVLVGLSEQAVAACWRYATQRELQA